MRFVLLATALRLAQAATPINDWVWGAMGASCATTCSGLGRTCDDERIWAIKGTNSGGFKAARAGAGWETAYCATEVDGFDSTGGVSYRDTNQRCYYPNTQSPISKPSGLCGFTFNGVNQQSMYVVCAPPDGVTSLRTATGCLTLSHLPTSTHTHTHPPLPQAMLLPSFRTRRVHALPRRGVGLRCRLRMGRLLLRECRDVALVHPVRSGGVLLRHHRDSRDPQPMPCWAL